METVQNNNLPKLSKKDQKMILDFFFESLTKPTTLVKHYPVVNEFVEIEIDKFRTNGVNPDFFTYNGYELNLIQFRNGKRNSYTFSFEDLRRNGIF